MSSLPPFTESADRSTRFLHSAPRPASGDPLVQPLVQSTTFCQGGIGAGGHAYSRVSNPTVDALETALGSLENAPPGVCFASGLAAETALFLALLRAGDHCVCGHQVYGGTTRLLGQVLEGLGVRTTFVDSTSPQAIAEAITADTRLVFVETPANPTLDLTDIEAISRITRERAIPLGVDNTFLTSAIQQPLDLGADISVYSTTKFVDGHSAALGGAIVSRDPALLERVRFIRKSTGAIQSPLNSWLTLQGLKTLPLRIERQSQTAAALAQWLLDRPGVRLVHHPSLATGEARRIAERQHAGNLHGGVVTFELDTETCDIHRFLGALRLCRLVEHVGSVETLITHPASMTHADVPPAQRAEAGIADGLLRVSVGLEGLTDITADLERAFEVSRCSVVTRRGEESCQPVV